ncbi:NUDIX domain-containing protein [Mesobacillus subterraneus]|uniref:NUDIX hydrolase n=1 Tax=Mesobacillus subterraneus TaxID=285983 RepID=UPI00203B70DC|nr:NUDIX domain-containing protein [Mesobacillus subterraneus]MCM3666460.1 NUDIX domain-containing protein [Mesobacillus subterraneus]MCM3685459.1 NUDIX domain-containing protein [Mesobacillus subterraneus]
MINFGNKEPGVRYVRRPAVYGVVFNDPHDKIALIQTADGKFFLPGGGLESGESHEECLRREGIEEMGMLVEIGGFIGSARRYFYSSNERKHYLSEGHFYFGNLAGKAGVQAEAGHFLKWMEPSKAMERLFHEHQSWAVCRAEEMIGFF